MRVIINPGSGPVADASLANATDNMPHLVADMRADGARWVRVDGFDEDGRFGFLVWRDIECHLIEMPGLPLERVRYMRDDQNIWDFPRLYVDGSSWVWKFAIGCFDPEDER